MNGRVALFSGRLGARMISPGAPVVPVAARAPDHRHRRADLMSADENPIIVS